MTKPTVILVDIEHLRDWYVATSCDLPGLLAAHSDLSVLLSEIPEVIRLMYKAKSGINVKVREGSPPESSTINQLRYVAEAA